MLNVSDIHITEFIVIRMHSFRKLVQTVGIILSQLNLGGPNHQVLIPDAERELEAQKKSSKASARASLRHMS